MEDEKTIGIVLIREAEMGSVGFGQDAERIGIVPEWIALRGEKVRLGIYRVRDPLSKVEPTESLRIETVDVVRDASRVKITESIEVAGKRCLAVRLVDVILVTR